MSKIEFKDDTHPDGGRIVAVSLHGRRIGRIVRSEALGGWSYFSGTRVLKPELEHADLEMLKGMVAARVNARLATSKLR